MPEREGFDVQVEPWFDPFDTTVILIVRSGPITLVTLNAWILI